jgi:hypothetical protein
MWDFARAGWANRAKSSNFRSLFPSKKGAKRAKTGFSRPNSRLFTAFFCDTPFWRSRNFDFSGFSAAEKKGASQSTEISALARIYI